MIDPEEERAQARERWETAAPGWAGGADGFQAGVLPVAHWMVDALAPQPGQAVLELAAGRGDVGLLAAELLAPGGKVTITDGAEAMVEVARKHAEARGAAAPPTSVEVEFKPMELEWIDAKLASLDGILCRFGYMHAVDPEAALREARRVLKPGGKVVLTVWASPSENPWLAAIPEAAAQLGLAPPITPDQPGAFALASDGLLADLLEDAGFDEPTIEPLDLTFTAPSLDAWWETMRAMSSTMGPLLKSLSPADHYNLRDAVEERWTAHQQPDGTLALPGRALGAVAEA